MSDVDAPRNVYEMMVEARALAMEPKPTLDEMIAAAETEAISIEGRQLSMLKIGDSTRPDPGYVRRSVVFDAAARLLRLIQDNQAAVARVLKAGGAR